MEAPEGAERMAEKSRKKAEKSKRRAEKAKETEKLRHDVAALEAQIDLDTSIEDTDAQFDSLSGKGKTLTELHSSKVIALSKRTTSKVGGTRTAIRLTEIQNKIAEKSTIMAEKSAQRAILPTQAKLMGSLKRKFPGGSPEDDGPITLNFEKIGRLASVLFSSVPICTFLGEFFKAVAPAPVARAKKRRRKIVKASLSDASYTQRRTTEEENTETVYSTMVANDIENYLEKMEKAGEPMQDLIRVLCHPSDYTQTVENFFAASTLLKNGMILITFDVNGMPLISKPSDAEMLAAGTQLPQTQASQPSNQSTQSSHGRHAVLPMSRDIYKKMISTWKMAGEAPVLPERHERIERERKKRKERIRRKMEEEEEDEEEDEEEEDDDDGDEEEEDEGRQALVSV